MVNNNVKEEKEVRGGRKSRKKKDIQLDLISFALNFPA